MLLLRSLLRHVPAAPPTAPGRRARPPRALRRATLVALLLGLGFALAPSAFAHAELVSSSPADGSTVSRQPGQVLLTFDEAVSDVGDAVVVTSPSGARVDDGPTRVDGAKVSVALERLTEAGEYTIAFRVVSDDGHPVADKLSFTFEPAAASGSPSPTATTSPTPVSASPAAAEDTGTGGSATPWIVVAVLAVIIVVVAWLVMRRRRA